MSEKLEKLELKEWLASASTKKFIRVLENTRLIHLEHISKNFVDNDIIKITLGKCEGLQLVIDILTSINDEIVVDEILETFHFNIYQPKQLNNE